MPNGLEDQDMKEEFLKSKLQTGGILVVQIINKSDKVDPTSKMIEHFQNKSREMLEKKEKEKMDKKIKSMNETTVKLSEEIKKLKDYVDEKKKVIENNKGTINKM